MTFIYRIVFAAAILALLIGPARLGLGRATILPGLEGAPLAFADGSFTADGVYSRDSARLLPKGLDYRGSWVGSDAFQGEYTTGWYAPPRAFLVKTSGYPALPGLSLEAAFRFPDGHVETIPYRGANTGEAWYTWSIETPAEAVAVQLRASDRTGELCGWLAFSAPFTIADQISRQLWALLQITTTFALALTLLYGPGLLWLGRQSREASALAPALLFGPLLLAGLGAFCWICGGWIAPATVARVGIVGILGWLGWQLWQLRTPLLLPATAHRIVAASALLAGFAVAKANLSLGPEGELFGGSISRTLEVGGHSDSRISYHTVQVISNHLGPFSPDAQKFFSPWNFASRGPLAGLIAAPVVLATGAQVPRSFPDQTWQPFDAEGFAVYRLVLIALASLLAWAVFGVTAGLTSPAWGFVAGVTVLFAPFFVHEMYFSWPKSIAAALILLAFQRAQQRRPLLAGITLGLGYLFHPLALLSAPFLAGWILLQPEKTSPPTASWPRRSALLRAMGFTVGVLLCFAPWQLFGKLGPEGGGQLGFLNYFLLADNRPADWATWWQTRWANFAHTFLPFYFFTVDPHHESINSMSGPSNGWVRAGFIYWNTLPFALGLPAFGALAVGIFSAARRAGSVVLLTFVGPALLLIAYWGAACTGLMRHCGHGLFATVIVLGVWGFRPAGETPRRLLAFFLHPACLAWRAAEIALMAFGTTLLFEKPNWRGPYGWNDGLSFLAAAGCVVLAAVLLAGGVRSAHSQIFESEQNERDR